MSESDIYMRKYKAFVSKISEVDPIFDYKTFCKMIKSVKNAPLLTLPHRPSYGDESTRHYGYYQAILNYGKCDSTKFVYIPVLEHGIRFGHSAWFDGEKDIMGFISFACQGPGRSSEIYSIDPWKPVFILGPYIHYATPYYTKQKIMEIKDKLGRVLLVFPSHTTDIEDCSQAISSNLSDTIYHKYALDYDTVIVCSYWNDVDSYILGDFEKRGALLVSAGFRSDPNFIRRLKSIIELADGVVVDDLQTNIGFCKYMGKNVYFEGAASRLPDDKYYTENYNRFYDAFYSQDKTFTIEQYKKQNELYEFFWGGEKYLKSPEEIYNIFSVLKEMCDKTHYNIKKMPEFICENYKKNSSSPRYKLLAEAISPQILEKIL